MPLRHEVFLRRHTGDGGLTHPLRLPELRRGQFGGGQPAHPPATRSGRARCSCTDRGCSAACRHPAHISSVRTHSSSAPACSRGSRDQFSPGTGCGAGQRRRPASSQLTLIASQRARGCGSSGSPRSGRASSLLQTRRPVDHAPLPCLPETNLPAVHATVRIRLLRLLQGEGRE
jgi:hypothetical protein